MYSVLAKDAPVFRDQMHLPDSRQSLFPGKPRLGKGLITGSTLKSLATGAYCTGGNQDYLFFVPFQISDFPGQFLDHARLKTGGIRQKAGTYLDYDSPAIIQRFQIFRSH